MRRRRWARAAALCLAIAVVLQLAVRGGAGTPLPRHARCHAAERWLPSPSPEHVPGARGDAARGVTVAFAATAGARCKRSTARKSGPVAVGRGTACAADDDDDKRVVPTGPNPLHNR
ncbi:unnamed protein product [Alopecurus aequalis]